MFKKAAKAQINLFENTQKARKVLLENHLKG